jgi:hypothetical protein
MPSTLDISRYHAALRLLQEGRRDGTLVLAGELLQSGSGRALGWRLLAEIYPEGAGGRKWIEGSATLDPGLAAGLLVADQEA